MDDILRDLYIPKKQINGTEIENRYRVIVHKSWIKSLIENKKLLNNVPYYKDEIIQVEWPKKKDLDKNWDFVYVAVYKKQPLKKVIPLPKIIHDTQEHLPLTYSQLLQHVQQNNHKNLWRQHHKKFGQSTAESKRLEESSKKKIPLNIANNLMSYDLVLRECISRLYEIPIIHSKLDKTTTFKDNENKPATHNQFEVDKTNANYNLLPIIGAIESNSHYFLVFNYVENTVTDCLSYSPAILDKSHNKNLFVIYQLLNFIKFMHSRGLFVGNMFGFQDILINENLMIYIIPRIEANLIEYEDAADSNLPQDPQISGKSLNVYSLNYQYTLREFCEMWCQGKLSNFDYLTILNNFAGRKTGNCPENHHIMPWVIDFTTKQGNWRDLTKSKYRLNKGDRQLDLTYQYCSNVSIPHHVTESLSEITYYVYMARKTPKSILCKHVRSKFVAEEYPGSIKRMQEWSPDECIPEFYSDPSVFKSIHEDLPDLEVPSWSSCPEDFVMKHREILESQNVSENLHHWIDLSFGYKLSGKAAVKAKNVCLFLVDQHTNLCQKGIIQLFDHPHPPKQTKNAWFGKIPPRINSEIHKRLTRSSEDLSIENFYATEEIQTSSSPRNTNRLAHQSESMERSTSYHTNVQRPNTNQILLPKNFNPIAQLKAVENMENFLSKTFYDQQPKQQQEKTLPASIMTTSFLQNYLDTSDSDNAFTNRMFLETYEASLIKDNKMYRNMKHKNFIAEHSKRNFKQIVIDHRQREIQVLGCLIVELFFSIKTRPLTSLANKFEERFDACRTILKHNLNALPKCLQYAVKLFFDINDFDEKIITDKGLPTSTLDNLLIEPILSNMLIPFPDFYIRLYAALQSLSEFDSIVNYLNYYMYFECNGRICEKLDTLEKAKISIIRRVAECKVKSFVMLVNDLIEPKGLDQFIAMEILLPHILSLFASEESSILAAWYLFDPVATALGMEESRKILLYPILQLYDIQNAQLNSVFESMRGFQASSFIFKSRKAVKLYHHSFLLKLIVRFGLKCFLENFIVPLIESVGAGAGHREFDIQHLHKTTQTKTETFEDVNEEMFAFDNEESKGEEQPVDTEKVIMKMLDHLEMGSEGSSVDLRLNHSSADEMTEENFEEHLNDFTIGDEKLEIYSSSQKTGPKSPEIAIPSSFKRSIEVNSINCEIGSRKSTDSFDFMPKTPTESLKANQDESEKHNKAHSKATETTNKLPRYARISEMSSESLIWLAHRLGPVLTARYITRNLLKMLTLCYVSQENLMPNTNVFGPHICHFTVADGNVLGDEAAENVIDSLTSIAALFGEEFILLQYFPHISELVGISKNKITQTLEGGLIGSLVLIKSLIPCMSDKMILEQLQDMILKNVINPIIRLLGSCRIIMPNGYLARSVLARKLLDTMYVISVRIGVEFTKKNLCVPALQRFFLIFDKAYGNAADVLRESNSNPDPEQSQENLSIESSEESTHLEVQKDGKTTEWKVKKNTMLPANDQNAYNPVMSLTAENSREKGLEEIRDVFNASLAHNAYMLFLNLLGEAVMKSTLKNVELIINLSHDHEIPSYSSMEQENKFESTQIQDVTDSNITSNSFNSNVAIVGNRIDVQFDNETTPVNSNEVQKLVAYKLDNCISNRKLRGNWLAYWQHEIGRAEKDTSFNIKQIKLQQYSGHTNSIRSILCLDNENSFMSASKDKTVKLWSLRNEGDGTKISSCQYTYNNHRKSVHSLTFLDSLRLTVSCDSSVHLWDPFVGSQVGSLDHPRYIPVSVIKSFSSGSSLIMAGTADSSLKIIDGRTCDYVCEWKVTTTPTGSIRCLAVSPNGNWVAVGQSSGIISVLDARTGMINCTWKASEGELLQLLAFNDSSLISSSIDQNMSIWNVATGLLQLHFRNPPEPSHCLRIYENKLIAATPGNRIGSFDLSLQDHNQISFTRLRSELFKGILSSFEILPMNRMLLAGSESGHITLLV